MRPLFDTMQHNEDKMLLKNSQAANTHQAEGIDKKKGSQLLSGRKMKLIIYIYFFITVSSVRKTIIHFLLTLSLVG